ncbi:odorant receptor 13a-like [Phlebotomus papatasi]|nr:odorant receptor 13a-like [Phlebotomus papatasi]
MDRAEKVSKGFAYSYLVAATNFMVNPIITMAIVSSFKRQAILLEDVSLPIKTEYPFDITSSVFRLSAVFSVTVLAELYVLRILMGFDTLSVSLMNYCADLFKILSSQLRSLRVESSQGDQNIWTEENKKKILNDLKEIVNRHNQFIDFSDRLEEVLNPMMLAQYLSSTFMFCVVGFQLSILIESPYNFFIITTYCVSLGIQLFMYSWFGSYLTTAADEVSFAAYESEWFNTPVTVQKEIILIIQRSNHSVGITAAKFYYISIESFAKALSSAISYFTLLQTIYEK